MDSLAAQHQDILRYHNSKAVIQIIQENKFNPISRADIAKTLKMSPTSITRIITSLMELNLIRQEEAFSKGVGRNGINIGINKEAFLSLGFAIDIDYLKVCIIDCERCVVAEDIYRLTGGDYDLYQFLRQGEEMFLNLCKKNGIDSQRVKCLGVSSTGLIDYKKGITLFSPQLAWKNQCVKKAAEEVFGIPVCVDNDIKMGLIGATFQSAELNHADVVYFSIGTGVGAGVMYNGKMIRGINNAAGEIGHTMFSLGGRKCSCGKDGCLSAYISEPGVVQECNNQGHKIKDLKELMSACHGGEEWAERIVEDLTKDMSIAFCNMIYTYNPQYLLVGGNMVVDFPELYEMARTKLLGLLNEDFNLNVVIKKREFKNNEVLGAAFVAQEQYIDRLLKS